MEEVEEMAGAKISINDKGSFQVDYTSQLDIQQMASKDDEYTIG